MDALGDQLRELLPEIKAVLRDCTHEMDKLLGDSDPIGREDPGVNACCRASLLLQKLEAL